MDYELQLEKKLFDCSEAILEPYDCRLCPIQTKFMSILKEHIVESHSPQNPIFQLYKCAKCDFETWSQYSIVKHRELGACFAELWSFITKHSKRDNKTKRKFQCEHCSYKATAKYKLKRHQKSFHTDPSQIEWFQCHHCSYKAKFIRNLVRHHKNKHDAELQSLECEHCLNRNSSIHDVTQKEFECGFCLYKTLDRNRLSVHQKTLHMAPSLTEWFDCEQCQFKTRYKSNLVKHVQFKHGDRSKIQREWLQCELCLYRTQHKSNLRRHLKAVHTDARLRKWFHCKLCSYKTLYKHNLLRHKHIT